MSPEKTQIKNIFEEEGFLAVGFLSKQDACFDTQYLETWIRNDYHAEMSWMRRHTRIRENPCTIIDNGKSIITAVIPYHTRPPQKWKNQNPISNYAWGNDYHVVIKKKLNRIILKLKQLDPKFDGRAFVDTAPIPEKLIAARCGLGWIGKNAMLINRKLGSYLFIGEIVCNLDLPSDKPAKDYCGTCSKCIEHCPTNAILEGRVVDSRRCISYLTIEKRGDFTKDEEGFIDFQIFGCDICQQVCPWNKKAPFSEESDFVCAQKWLDLDFSSLSNISAAAYNLLKIKSPIKRATLEGIRRNAQLIATKQK